MKTPPQLVVFAGLRDSQTGEQLVLERPEVIGSTPKGALKIKEGAAWRSAKRLKEALAKVIRHDASDVL